VLDLVARRPAVAAAVLAAEAGMERMVFKRRVRVLKELGLAESLVRGYRLSPRGAAYLGRRA
jgi:DNA-binding IclR family transcriptional regulator